MKTCFPGLVFLLIAQVIFSQVTFEKTYGSFDNDIGYCVQPTADGGFILCGTTTNYYTYRPQIWIIKTDANGDTLWTVKSGNPQYFNYAYSVIETFEGDYVAAGSFGNDTGSICCLLKFDHYGNPVWARSYPYPGFVEEARSVVQTPDSGFIFCGISENPALWYMDAIIYRTDRNGNIIWKNFYGNYGFNSGLSIAPAVNGYVVSGGIDLFEEDEEDAWLFKVNSSGSQYWSKHYGVLNNDNYANCVKHIPGDNGFVFCGTSYGGFYGYGDVYYGRTDSAGNSTWTKRVGGPGNLEGEGIDVTADGGFILCGRRNDYNSSDYDVLLLKFNASGNIQWEMTFGGQYADGGYAVASLSDGYVICGYTQSLGAGGADVYLIRTDENGVVTGTGSRPEKNFLVYPNPGDGHFRISSPVDFYGGEIIDMTGKIVYNFHCPACKTLNIGLTDVASGILFLKLMTNNGYVVKKIIKQ